MLLTLFQLNLATPPSEDDRIPVLVLQAEGSGTLLYADREWPIVMTVDREWPVAMAAER
jgi:hypothetical protein